MTALATITTITERRDRKGFMARKSHAMMMSVSRLAMAEAVEDAQLNAIADERANGPFVRVSLDDL